MNAAPPAKPGFGLEPIVMTRVCTGAIQAFALFLLFIAQSLHLWPATAPTLFAALYLPLLLVPLVVAQGAGTIPARRLAVWAVGAAVVGAIMGVHGILRRAPGSEFGNDPLLQLVPEPPVHAAYAAVLFIAQALITAAAIDGRRIASYATYFHVAWKQGVQAVAGAGFTVVFWIVLALGAQLFKLVNITVLDDLIEKAWFAFPVTALAFMAALHVTDVRPQIIHNIKSLILTLLSWLLPVAAGIAAVFLASLPFTGLAPLWATKSATPILLGCSAGLLFLLNAAYQDGAPARVIAAPVRVMGTVAAALLLPMVAIAAYGVWLRIDQYGLTGDRVVAAACVLVAACYAAGYFAAAVARNAWLKPVETCNLVTSFIAIAVLVALFTPLADPGRLATASQVARLESGVIPPEQFDFLSLRFDNGRYGEAALRRLENEPLGAQAEAIKSAAAQALQARSKQDLAARGLDAAALAAGLMVSPPGQRLPGSFLTQNWGSLPEEAEVLAECLYGRTKPCTAMVADGDGDGTPEVILIAHGEGSGRVFRAEAGAWSIAARVAGINGCGDAQAALARGAFTLEAPLWRDLDVGGRRLTLIPKAAPCAGR